MKILSIETSCDETSISIVEIVEKGSDTQFNLLSHQLYSQIKDHQKYGGIVPTVAKREHSQRIAPLTKLVLEECGTMQNANYKLDATALEYLYKNDNLIQSIEDNILHFDKPDIDAIAVTYGPGLEPALWVGVNFAKVLSHIWNIPLYPINHMEGHIFSAFITINKIIKPHFPFISLLVSGGHTELVLVEGIGRYKVIGRTKDDAVGESFDKVARLLGFEYPGGPIISAQAEKSRLKNQSYDWKFPRPMLNSNDFDFSFSGLKTSVRYAIENKTLSVEDKENVSKEFEDAAIEVLKKKTVKALEEYGIGHIAVGGGVAANKYLQNTLINYVDEYKHLDYQLYLPMPGYIGDNSPMIGVAAYLKIKSNFLPANLSEIKANSSLSL